MPSPPSTNSTSGSTSICGQLGQVGRPHPVGGSPRPSSSPPGPAGRRRCTRSRGGRPGVDGPQGVQQVRRGRGVHALGPHRDDHRLGLGQVVEGVGRGDGPGRRGSPGWSSRRRRPPGTGTRARRTRTGRCRRPRAPCPARRRRWAPTRAATRWPSSRERRRGVHRQTCPQFGRIRAMRSAATRQRGRPGGGWTHVQRAVPPTWQREVMLTERRITGIENPAGRVTVRWVCWCGYHGSHHTGRSRRSDHRHLTTARRQSRRCRQCVAGPRARATRPR